MEFYTALYRYNEKNGSRFITQTYIAKQLGISRQALWQLVIHGGKRGLLKYKDKLKDILPEELYNEIDFPKVVRKRDIERTNKKIALDYSEKERLKRVRWVITKPHYDKIVSGKLLTQYRYNKLMKQIEEGEKWVKEKEKCSK